MGRERRSRRATHLVNSIESRRLRVGRVGLVLGAGKVLQNSGRNVFRQCDLLDFDSTPGYSLRFLKGGLSGCQPGGVAQLGERVNGIHEVRGSIPLASIRPPGATRQCSRRSERGPSHAGIAQLVEHNLAKVGVAGSSPVSRSAVPTAAQGNRVHSVHRIERGLLPYVASGLIGSARRAGDSRAVGVVSDGQGVRHGRLAQLVRAPR